MSLAVIYVFMILAILAAIFAIECRRLMFSVIGLIAMNLFVWIMLLTLNALLLAWIQLIVYGGGFTALFVVVVALTEKQRDEAFDWKRSIIALAIIAVIMALSIWAVVSSEGLYSSVGISTITESLEALWSERTMDLILQAVVFFATSIAIGTLFISHKKKKLKEEVEA
ncbi:MAG: NADH-quinone oxidoreductase subunit J [Candidatus Heimdallarchaeaceae archaeon]|jgi:NADH:ubiquinone oxidoreductase subunit 6 (subunit J)